MRLNCSISMPDCMRVIKNRLRVVESAREMSISVMIVSKEKGTFAEQEECEVERFLDVESMGPVGTEQSSAHREFSIRKEDESCHDCNNPIFSSHRVVVSGPQIFFVSTRNYYF